MRIYGTVYKVLRFAPDLPAEGWAVVLPDDTTITRNKAQAIAWRDMFACRDPQFVFQVWRYDNSLGPNWDRIASRVP